MRGRTFRVGADAQEEEKKRERVEGRHWEVAKTRVGIREASSFPSEATGGFWSPRLNLNDRSSLEIT
jgi:hypothetical protein